MENSFMFVVSVVLTIAVTTQRCVQCGTSEAVTTQGCTQCDTTKIVTTQGCTQCGTSGACCIADETCEATVDNGTCYKTKDKTTCNSKYYCYSPRICCSSSISDKTVCCPEKSECCKRILPFCCPLNSRCGMFWGCYSNNGSSSLNDSRGSSSSSSSSSRSYDNSPVLTLAVTTRGCIRCGTRGACCTADQTCEGTVDDGTCFKTNDKTTCNSNYHCYKPRTCCGYSFFGTTVCCPKNSKCCRSAVPFCCPLSSSCGTFSECHSDSDSNSSSGSGGSNSSSSSSKKTFRWYYIVTAVSVIGACVAVGIRLWLRNKRAAQTQIYANQRVVYSRCTPSYPSTMATISNVTYGVNLQTPVYNPPIQNDNTPVSWTTGYGGVESHSGKTMPPPPAYSDLVGQTASADAGVITAAFPQPGTEHV